MWVEAVGGCSRSAGACLSLNEWQYAATICASRVMSSAANTCCLLRTSHSILPPSHAPVDSSSLRRLGPPGVRCDMLASTSHSALHTSGTYLRAVHTAFTRTFSIPRSHRWSPHPPIYPSIHPSIHPHNTIETRATDARSTVWQQGTPPPPTW